ncbi:MAG: hypothetical protein ACRDOH_11540 [Streptosporangiaceae bacterium]
MDVAALDLGCAADLRFFLEYVREDGTRCREPLAVCAAERFEEAVPVRSFHWAKGAAHFPGSWWSLTTPAHVTPGLWPRPPQPGSELRKSTQIYPTLGVRSRTVLPGVLPEE